MLEGGLHDDDSKVKEKKKKENRGEREEYVC